MLWKIFLTILLLLIAWAVLFRTPLRRPGRLTKRQRNPLADQTLVKCPSCGIYMAAGTRCDCRVKG